MDEVRIQSKFMKSLISNIVKTKLKKKIGRDCNIQIYKLGFVNDGERTILNISADLEIDTNDLPKILEQIGLT